MYGVGLLSRFVSNPSKHHYGAAKRILRYIAGTADYGIMYENSYELKLIGFTDSDWAGSLDDHRSNSGNVFLLGGCAISWSSKKQSITALSSTEAEYIAATSASCQVVWLRRMLKDLGINQEEATPIMCDNKSTISIAKNPIHHGRTKHIDTRFHFIRELVTNGTIELQQVCSAEQLADIFTKALPIHTFIHLGRSLVFATFNQGNVLRMIEALNLNDRALEIDKI